MKVHSLDFKTTKMLSIAFSKVVIGDILSKQHSPLFSEVIKKIGLETHLRGKTYSYIFELFFNYLLKSYRNEYVYKNAIASKIVCGRHKFAASYFSEFRVWNSIADAMVINGTTTVYEIKTEYDSFTRLESQLNTYQQVFEHVYVVIPESKLTTLEIANIQKNIGIIILTKDYSLSKYRDSKSNIENLSPDMLFSCLRKREYEDIILKYYGYLPEVKPVYVRRECGLLLKKLDVDIIHKEFVNSLKSRYGDKDKRIMSSFPNSLLSLGMSMDLSSTKLTQLLHNLNSNILI